MNELQSNNGFMDVTSLEQAMQVSEMICRSQFCPKQFQGKPGDVLVCMQVGAELGIKPMQALQNIAVINGRPAVWGDAVLAICKQAPDWEWIDESIEQSTMTATCIVKRKGEPEVTVTFSQSDAKKAGLWGKQGPWTQYPARMLQMRARGFALRDAFPDRLRGIQTREEAMDIPLEKEAAASPEQTVSEDQVIELVTLAEQAQATPNDLLKAARKDHLEALTVDDYRSIKTRLVRKVKKIEEESKMEFIAKDSGAPDIESQKFIEELESAEA